MYWWIKKGNIVHHLWVGTRCIYLHIGVLNWIIFVQYLSCKRLSLSICLKDKVARTVIMRRLWQRKWDTKVRDIAPRLMLDLIQAAFKSHMKLYCPGSMGINIIRLGLASRIRNLLLSLVVMRNRIVQSVYIKPEESGYIWIIPYFPECQDAGRVHISWPWQ